MDCFDDFYFDEIFEDADKVKQVIAQAQEELFAMLKSSIKNTLEECAQASQELSTLKQQISKAKLEAQKWQRETEKAEEEFARASDFDIPKKYIDRIVHNLTGDFAPGDKAYVITTDGNYTTCKRCAGKKKIKAHIGTEMLYVQCPDCDGSGSVYVEGPPRIEEKTVTRVYLRLCFDGKRVAPWNTDNIFLDNSDWATKLKEIYHSPEEAQAALKGEETNAE